MVRPGIGSGMQVDARAFDRSQGDLVIDVGRPLVTAKEFTEIVNAMRARSDGPQRCGVVMLAVAELFLPFYVRFKLECGEAFEDFILRDLDVLWTHLESDDDLRLMNFDESRYLELAPDTEDHAEEYTSRALDFCCSMELFARYISTGELRLVAYVVGFLEGIGEDCNPAQVGGEPINMMFRQLFRFAGLILLLACQAETKTASELVEICRSFFRSPEWLRYALLATEQ